MSAKILPAVAAAILLGTTVFASAQTAPYPQGPRAYAPGFVAGPGAWYDPYAGTPFQGVAPYSSYHEPDPYAGTVFDGVAPY